MGIDAIISNNQLSSTAGQTSQANLGKDDFLKLMVMQMQHQDPLNPMDNEQMVSQMAQFSSLEQMSNLNKTMAEQANLGSFMEATGLLGKEVQILDPNAAAGEEGILSTTVRSVNYTSSGPVLNLDNGHTANVTDLLSVKEPEGL